MPDDVNPDPGRPATAVSPAHPNMAPTVDPPVDEPPVEKAPPRKKGRRTVKR
jgi:hypothetical protein